MSINGKVMNKYRAAAERLYRDRIKELPLSLDGDPAADFRVPSYGGVHDTEEGAYVEIQVWVPKAAIES